MNEGFFADVAVLVEGEEDRAAILGVAKTLKTAEGQDVDLENLGISVIPCLGKNNLDRPTAIFRELDISVYTIWDGDWKPGANADSNHLLLRLCGGPIEDWPQGVFDHYACFKVNLRATLQSEIGTERFDRLLQPWLDKFSYDRDDGMKNPLVIQGILKDAHAEGTSCPTLISIVKNVVRLRGIEVAPQ